MAGMGKRDDIAGGQEWTVDLFRPEDAEGVALLFLAVYGEGYPIRTYVDPQLLARENAAGRVISSVARTPKGNIVGHNALFHSAPYERIRESGAGLVHAAYRGGQGIFTAMVEHGGKAGAERFGIEGVYGESVCNHVFSQRMCRSLGWRSQAVEVDLMPAAAYTAEGSAPGRVSSLLDFKTLVTKEHTVYLPAVYRRALDVIYAGLDDARRAEPSNGSPPSGSQTELRPRVFDFARVARVAVECAGSDFGDAVASEEGRLVEKGVAVIQMWLRLDCPWVGWTADRLRARGYFLGGLLPRWFDADGLLMQKIMARPGWEDMKIAFDRGREIVRLAREDWEDVKGPETSG